ncbi:MAG: hypothetical protein ACI8WB_000194 [Phenylobacterium sp.]|jgi:hypothetical protein
MLMTDLNEIFIVNARLLRGVLGLNNNQIANTATSRGYNLSRSYVGKVLDAKHIVNIGLDKVAAFCAGLGQRPVDMFNPLGFTDGKPQGITHLLDEDVLDESIAHVEMVMEQMEVVDPTFKHRAITIVYAHKMKGGDIANVRHELKLLLQDD